MNQLKINTIIEAIKWKKKPKNTLKKKLNV